MRVSNIEESGGVYAQIGGLSGLRTSVNSKDCVIRVQHDETKEHGMEVPRQGPQRAR